MADETEIWNLIKDIEMGKRWLYKLPPWSPGLDYLSWHYGNVVYISNDGWKVVVFFDCGGFDYFDNFISPSDKTLGFDEFSDDLKAYRPPDDIRKVLYGEPGYLGCWLNREACSTCGRLVGASDEHCSYCGVKINRRHLDEKKRRRSSEGQPCDHLTDG